MFFVFSFNFGRGLIRRASAVFSCFSLVFVVGLWSRSRWSTLKSNQNSFVGQSLNH